jgi:hypothetical protein
MNGIDAVITAEGEFAMMMPTTEEQAALDTRSENARTGRSTQMIADDSR